MKKAVKAILSVLSYGGIEVESARSACRYQEAGSDPYFSAKIGYGNI